MKFECETRNVIKNMTIALLFVINVRNMILILDTVAREWRPCVRELHHLTIKQSLLMCLSLVAHSVLQKCLSGIVSEQVYLMHISTMNIILFGINVVNMMIVLLTVVLKLEAAAAGAQRRQHEE